MGDQVGLKTYLEDVLGVRSLLIPSSSNNSKNDLDSVAPSKIGVLVDTPLAEAEQGLLRKMLAAIGIFDYVEFSTSPQTQYQFVFVIGEPAEPELLSEMKEFGAEGSSSGDLRYLMLPKLDTLLGASASIQKSKKKIWEKLKQVQVELSLG